MADHTCDEHQFTLNGTSYERPPAFLLRCFHRLPGGLAGQRYQYPGRYSYRCMKQLVGGKFYLGPIMQFGSIEHTLVEPTYDEVNDRIDLNTLFILQEPP